MLRAMRTRTADLRRRDAGLLLLALVVWVAPAAGQVNREIEEIEGIDVEQKLDAHLPLDAEFLDDQGRLIRLGDYFDGRRPVILNLVYYKCPMLCGLLLTGMVDTLKELAWTPGEQFQIVTLSFDPLEHNTDLARLKKQNTLLEYGRAEAATGWSFLTGRKEQIERVAGAVGFKYRWNREREEWAHPSTLILCTPDGRVARYLGGILFEPEVLRLSLVESSRGKIGSLWDKVFLTCFHYVSSDGKYTPNVLAIMKLGGAVTVLALGTLVLGLLRWESRRRGVAQARLAGSAVLGK